MRKYFLLLLLFPLLLAGKEKAFFKVVLPANASKIEKAAGAELTSYLKKLYTKPIVFQGKKVPLLTFYVGKNSLKGAKLPGDYPEFFLKAGKDFILLAGHDEPGLSPWSTRGETGTLLAVYYFLRKYGGLTVFAPGSKGEKLALNTPITLPPLVIPRPSYQARYINLAMSPESCKIFSGTDRQKFFKKMLCYMPRFAMPEIYYFTFQKWDKRFKHRPELYSVHEGKRVNTMHPRHLPCFANKEVFQIIEKDLMQELARKKKAKSIRLFCDASVKICECKECSREKNISNYFYSNVIKIANLIHKKRPDIYFHTQEKLRYYFHPPQGVKLAKNMVVDIATGFPSAKSYTANIPLFKAWKKAGALPMIRFYHRTFFWKDYPICNPRATVRHYAFMQPYAIGTKNGEGGPKVPYFQFALLAYLQAEVLFDHTLNGEKAMMKFFSLAYPGAEKEMMEYYTYMEKKYFSHPSWMNPLHGSLQYSYLLVGEKILERALAKVKDPYFLRPLYEDLLRVRRLAEKSKDMMDEHNAYMAKFHTFMTKKIPLSIPFSDTPIKKMETWLLRPADPVKGPYQEGRIKIARDKENIHFILEADEKEIKEMTSSPTFGRYNTLEIMITPPEVQFPYVHLVTYASQESFIVKYYESGAKEKIASRGVTLRVQKYPGKKKWTMTGNIPLSYLKGILKNNKGRIGILRCRYRNGGKEVQKSALNAGISHAYSTYLPFTMKEK